MARTQVRFEDDKAWHAAVSVSGAFGTAFPSLPHGA